MVGKVLLLTGVPAAGKTTLANEVKETIQPMHVITFGEFILEVKKRGLPNVNYADLRSNPTREAGINLIEEATVLLLKHVSELRDKSNILIDSHAVAKDEYGFRITPDSHSFLQKIKLDAILILHANHQAVVSRINAKSDGRRLVTVEEVATHEVLQDSVSIAYAVATGCPVFIINADTPPKELLEKLLKIFDAIEMTYSKLKGKDGQTSQ